MPTEPLSKPCNECNEEWSAPNTWEDGEVWVCEDCKGYPYAN